MSTGNWTAPFEPAVTYNAALMQKRMAELGLNWYRLGRKAKVDPKTAKKVVTTGSGQPDSIAAIAKVLRFRLDEILLEAEELAGSGRRA